MRDCFKTKQSKQHQQKKNLNKHRLSNRCQPQQLSGNSGGSVLMVLAATTTLTLENKKCSGSHDHCPLFLWVLTTTAQRQSYMCESFLLGELLGTGVSFYIFSDVCYMGDKSCTLCKPSCLPLNHMPNPFSVMVAACALYHRDAQSL